MLSHACLHILTSAVSHIVLLLKPTHNKPHALPFTHALANTCVSTHLPTQHSHTSHINSLASVTGGHTYTRTCTHANTNTRRHTNTVLLSAVNVPF